MPEDLNVLFPGKVITFDGAGGKQLSVTVFPMGSGHVRKFNAAVTKCFARVRALSLDTIEMPADIRSMTDSEWAAIVMKLAKTVPQIAIVVMDELMDLVAECVEGVDLKSTRCPIHLLPDIVLAWLMESFGDEKKARPWINLAEQIFSKVTGKPLDLWGVLSKRLSAGASAQTTPSPASGPASHTADGHSLSSGTS